MPHAEHVLNANVLIMPFGSYISEGKVLVLKQDINIKKNFFFLV